MSSQPPPPPPGMPPPPPGMPPPPPGVYGYPAPRQVGYDSGSAAGYPGGYPVAYSPGPQGYAPWISRVAATLIDSLTEIPFAIPAIVAFAASGATSTEGTCRNLDGVAYTCNQPNGPLLALGFGLLVAGLVAFVVWYCRRVGRTGQSVGRKALGYKIVDKTTGLPIGSGKAFARLLARIVDQLACYLGYLWPLWDKEHQTLSDKIVNTVAVKV